MRLNRIRSNRRLHAFTLIELMVVILILAILAALIVPRVVGRQDEAKRSKAAADISSLSSALQQFRLDCDRYPSTEEGLMALRQAPPDVNNWKGPYLQKAIPTDPWGNEYVYEYPGADEESYVLLSFGADGVEGGENNNADISEGIE